MSYIHCLLFHTSCINKFSVKIATHVCVENFYDEPKIYKLDILFVFPPSLLYPTLMHPYNNKYLSPN